MIRLLKRYRATVAVFLGFSTPLFILYIHGKDQTETSILERTLAKTTAPFQNMMNDGIHFVQGVWGDYISLVGVQTENERLRERVNTLEGQAIENRRLRLENERLVELCEFRRTHSELNAVAAHVVSKDHSPYYRVVRIALDVGSEDDISEGMPVITHRGVVGRIARVTDRFADVMLSVDPRSRIDVEIAARGVSGTLEGRGDSNIYGARFFFLHRGGAIQEHDVVVTSGHDRVFPPGLVVGYVARDEERQTGVYYEYDVVPAVNFATLEEVLVVRSTRPRPPDFDRLP